MAKKPSSKAKNTTDNDVSPKDEAAEDIAKTGENQASVSDDATTVDAATGDDTLPIEDDTEAAYSPSDDTPDATADDTSDTSAATDPAEPPREGEAEATADQPAENAADAPKDSDDSAPDGTTDTTTETNSDTASTPAALPARTPQPQKGPGAGGMVLGGIAAGAIGFAAAYFGLAQQTVPRDEALMGQVAELNQQVDDQAGTISSLAEKVGGITNTDDSALEAQIEALGTLSERVANVESQIEALDARLADVEQRPVTESADAATIAAYEEALDSARAEMAAQREELEALIAEAMSTETAADQAARASIQRAAVSRIRAALDSGAGFAGAVADLQGTGFEVPEALTSVAESGVATLSGLRDTFPDAARAALDASRDATAGGSGLTGFLRNQLGARSLEPREGNDPDAVLSRIEAALRDNRLRDALAEMDALPDAGRAELSDWAGRASRRVEAVSAAQALGETLN